MSTELITIEPTQSLPVAIESPMGNCFAVTNYSDAQRVAKTLSASALVPETFRAKGKDDVGAIANCMIALDMSLRLKMSPLMVMQNMYIVHGRPAWSGAFLVAAINQSGLFKTPLRYKQSGEGDDFGCVAWAVDHSGERLESTRITIKMAKAEGWYGKSGSKWQTMPEQMLKYRAASFFCRAYCPEVAMGMQTSDERYDVGTSESIEEVVPPKSMATKAKEKLFGDDAPQGTDHVNASY
jgi:hypothetical protein